MNWHSTKFKIIGTAIACVLLVGIISNALLYNYLNGIIVEKAERIDQLNLDTVESQIQQRISNVFNLGILCANDNTITTATNFHDLSSLAAKQGGLRAQTLMTSYLRSSAIERYTDKFLVFNTNGLVVQSGVQAPGTMQDYAKILKLPAFAEISAPGSASQILCLSPSIVHSGEDAFILMAEMQGVGAKKKNAFVYLELNINLFEDILAPFNDVQNIFITSGDGKNILTSDGNTLPFDLHTTTLDQDYTFKADGQRYKLRVSDLENCDLMLYSYINLTQLSRTDGKIGYPVFVVMVTCLLIALGLAVILSNYITRPINRLIARIRRISENDFAYDPTIEQSQDEIGQIGKVVNEMTMSIDHLIKETESMYEQRKNIEISLLQSQVNPHFLYNTLDSLHWMAVIQKNPGIANMTRSLVNLLKNIAKGTQDKITLREEISLLQDYIAIQSVRYLETFEFRNEVPDDFCDYRIIKLTLQPLVENAIFHGIEPTGRYGTITLSAREEGEDIILTVTDDGAGMEKQQCTALFTVKTTQNKGSLNGIGVSNVHTRLQLVYGKQYGLSVESEKDQFTRVSVRIPKER